MSNLCKDVVIEKLISRNSLAYRQFFNHSFIHISGLFQSLWMKLVLRKFPLLTTNFLLAFIPVLLRSRILSPLSSVLGYVRNQQDAVGSFIKTTRKCALLRLITISSTAVKFQHWTLCIIEVSIDIPYRILTVGIKISRHSTKEGSMIV